MTKSSRRVCRTRKMQREVTDALLYRGGDGLYLGGTELYHIVNLLGGTWGDDSATDLVERAAAPELRDVHRYLNRIGFIDYGKQRRKELTKGVVFCPYCGRALHEKVKEV